MNKLLVLLWILVGVCGSVFATENPHRARQDYTIEKKMVWDYPFPHYVEFRVGVWEDSLHTDKGTKYFSNYQDGSFDEPILWNWWTNYTWNSTNTSVNITNAVFGTLLAGDNVTIPTRAGSVGYRSFSFSGIGVENQGGYINIIWQGFVAPNAGGNLFANSMDNSNWVRIYGLNMSNHTDPLMFTHASTGYSHYIYWDSCTLHNMPGIFGSGPQPTSLTSFVGSANDTVNCFYHWKFRKIDADSIGNTTNGGLTTLWMGSLSAKDVWLNVEVSESKFDWNPSPTGSGAACFIHAQNCFYLRIHDNIFSNLGVVTNPQGHAASNFCQGSLVYIYNNFFKANFANCARVVSSASLPGMTTLFTNWDATYDGIGRFYNNILDSGRKYPMYESQKDTVGLNGLTYLQPRRSGRVWNNTMYRGGSGANGNGPYMVSSYDWYFVTYTVDTLEIHNSIQIGPPTDTVAVFCGSQACNAFITRPNNGTPFYDTSGNKFSQLTTFATSGLLDTTTFRPIPGGILSTGVHPPSWLTSDYYGTSYPSGGPWYIGAVQYNSGTAPPNKIILHRGYRGVYIKI